ncbi:MAG TPA: Trm112 family protein [Chloroflexota bacterium]|jgi:hypothetical protein
MIAKLGRLALRITVAGVVIGAAAAAIAVGAIAISELLTRRRDDEFDEELGDFGSGAPVGAPQELDEEFLSLLACPVCKTSVRREGDRLVCDTCGRRYPIREGIPVMLVEEAEMPQAGTAPAS